MYKIVTETEKSTYEYFRAFGFGDEEIASLVSHGKRDIIRELEKLRILLEASSYDIDAINDRLHALKGLFSQLGNKAIADQLNEIRQDLDSHESIDKISDILFDPSPMSDKDYRQTI